MTDERLYQPHVVKEHIARTDFRFSKSLGQNFLIDGNILRKIADAAAIEAGDCVLEIGTGIGTLTEELALRGAKVLTVEIDERLRPIQANTIEKYENVVVLFGDVLKIDLEEEVRAHFGEETIKVVANLPYYVTTPILMRLLTDDLNVTSIHVMVQKELGDRLSAEPGNKDYGSLTVGVQLRADVERVLTVSRNSFMPPPKVDSVVVGLTNIRENPFVDYPLMEQITKAAFSKRRKTISNALTTYGFPVMKEEIEEALMRTGIDPSKRAEQIRVEEFLFLGENFPKIPKEDENGQG